LQKIRSEVSGEWDIPPGEIGPGEMGAKFRLRGRADRVEKRADGTLAILDYKTGIPPSQKQVDAGLAPQLLLEAAMAQAGAFGPEFLSPVSELTYWHLTGGTTPGQARQLCKGNPQAIAEAIANAVAGLRRLIAAYDNPEQCYLAQPFPTAAPRFSDFSQLARVAEWSAGGESAGGGNE
jgi:ATP-dependent helicase/nuclease subunit B